MQIHFTFYTVSIYRIPYLEVPYLGHIKRAGYQCPGLALHGHQTAFVMQVALFLNWQQGQPQICWLPQISNTQLDSPAAQSAVFDKTPQSRRCRVSTAISCCTHTQYSSNVYTFNEHTLSLCVTANGSLFCSMKVKEKVQGVPLSGKREKKSEGDKQ